MQYRKDRNGDELSALGYGCMRFSRKGGGIDLEKTEKELLKAYGAGVNYFDTAYIYPGSEAALGTILKKNGIREKVKIATKLPQYLVSSAAGAEKYFREELSRLQTDYVDYYLMHHMTDPAQWDKLVSAGIPEWIEEKKKSGEIRNIGFSYHGNTERFVEILNAYDWDFCQIQYNYIDEHSQAGRTGLQTAAAKGIPVIIMEPLRGGKLVGLLPKEAKEMIASHEHGWSAAGWAFRWLYNQPEVTVVLSGMNSEEMVEENVRTAEEALPGSLTEQDLAFYEELKKIIKAKEKVPCTGCRYCMPCPKGVDIPSAFLHYNLMYSESRQDGRKGYYQSTVLTKQPAVATQCVKCGKCEKRCPQSIPIREKLKEADRHLRPYPIRPALAIARKFFTRGK